MSDLEKTLYDIDYLSNKFKVSKKIVVEAMKVVELKKQNDLLKKAHVIHDEYPSALEKIAMK